MPTQSETETILLVEDEAVTATIEKAQLEEYGYVVRAVTTGEQAIEAVQSSSAIDLILTDIDLGDGMDGTQAAEIILKDRDIPIIFLSSHTETEIVEKTEHITSYGYVVKNSSATVLDASIKMAFKLATANRQLKDELAERERSEKELSFQNVLMETQMEASLDGIVIVNAHEKITSFNQRFADMWEIPDSIMASQSAEKAMQYVLPKLTNPDEFTARIRDLYKDKREKSYEEIALTDGRIFERYSSPMLSSHGEYYGRVWFYRDITERKRFEQKLIQKQQYLETILETTADGFSVVAPDGKLVDVNAAYCKMSGYSKDELTRMEISDLEAIENPQETEARVKRIIENGSETFATKHRRKDGSIFEVEVSSSRLDHAEGMFLVCFFRVCSS